MNNKEKAKKVLKGYIQASEFNSDDINVYHKQELINYIDEIPNEILKENKFDEIRTTKDMMNGYKKLAEELKKHINDIDFDHQIASVYSWSPRDKGVKIGHGPMTQILQEDSIAYHSDTSFADIPNVSKMENFKQILELSYEKEERKLQKRSSVKGILSGDISLTEFLSEKMGSSKDNYDPIKELQKRRNEDLKRLEEYTTNKNEKRSILKNCAKTDYTEEQLDSIREKFGFDFSIELKERIQEIQDHKLENPHLYNEIIQEAPKESTYEKTKAALVEESSPTAKPTPINPAPKNLPNNSRNLNK